MPPRCRRLIPLLAGVAVLAGPVAMAAEPLRLDRPDGRHLREIPDEPPLQPNYLPRIPPRLEATMLYRFTGPLKTWATYDRELSELCRRGGFGQEIDGLFYASTPEQRYGIALRKANLYDPFERHQPNTIYFFDKQETSRCAVYVASADAVRPMAVPR